MSSLAVPDSPKHGYEFDGHEHDVRKSRKLRACEGGAQSRASTGNNRPHAENCMHVIYPGDLMVATVRELFRSEHFACIPCGLAVGAIKPVGS